MNLFDNTKNAFDVVRKTYESIDKLLPEVDRIGIREGYTSITPRFLRWKSDTDYTGWNITSFIKLYQDNEDTDFNDQGGIKDGFIYGFEITLIDGPSIIMSRYKFDNLDTWKALPAVSEHWGFYYPIRGSNGNFSITDLVHNDQNYRISKPKDKQTSTRHWDITEVIFKQDTLLDITPRTLKRKSLMNFVKWPKSNCSLDYIRFLWYGFQCVEEVLNA